MISSLFCVVVPALLKVVDASETPQVPLGVQSLGNEFDLQLDSHHRYHIEIGNHKLHLSLSTAHSIAELAATSKTKDLTTSIYVPQDPFSPGLIASHSVHSTHNDAERFSSLAWLSTPEPGHDIPIWDIGIRKGGMLSMNATTARLAPETPYISLPASMYNVIIQATQPAVRGIGSSAEAEVDCALVSQFPDLVVGLATDEALNAEGEVEADDLIVAPEHYVLRAEEGKCVLLVREKDEGERADVVLGWAAVRGRRVVLDWEGERTGFEELAGGVNRENC